MGGSAPGLGPVGGSPGPLRGHTTACVVRLLFLVRWQEGLRCVLLTESARSRLRVLGVNPLHEVQCKDLRMGTVQGIYSWGIALEMEI